MKLNYGKAIAVLVLIIGLWIINKTIQKEHINTTINYKIKIDSLNSEIIKIDSTHKKQDSIIIIYKDSIIYLGRIIEINKIKIIKLKEKYDKIRPTITKYSNVQLDSFFSSRYRHQFH
jgi:hypothetical protein